jgi:nitroreductase
MDTFEAIESRRSVKHFDPDHEFSEDEIKRLMSAALLSPTSFNMQNWRFVVVTDAALREKLRGASFNQAQVSEASALIVMTANLDAHKEDPERYWADAPAETAKAMVGMMVGFYEGNEQLKRDEAMRSVGIAAQTIMLAAKAMGYDSCPMIGFDPAKVGELINLPENHVIGMLITVGKALKPAGERAGQLQLEKVVIRDRFPSK